MFSKCSHGVASLAGWGALEKQMLRLGGFRGSEATGARSPVCVLMSRGKRSSMAAPGAAGGRRRTQAVFYRDADGAEPVDVFLDQLATSRPVAAAKIDDAIEEHLNGRAAGDPPPESPISSQVDGELRELRVRFAKTRYRLLYQRSENLIVLLHVFEKNTGAMPAREIETARRRMADFRVRMDAGRRRPPRAAGRDAPPKSRDS